METLKFGSKGERVQYLQNKLKELGYFKGSPLGNFLKLTEAAVKSFQDKNGLTVDGVVGPKTWAAIESYKDDDMEQVPDGIYFNPAYLEAKKYAGKNEKDKGFVAWLSSYWGKVGLKNYKTIVGSSFAWCALFFFTMNSNVGQDVIASAGAKRIGQSGFEINWKRDGIPQGAGVWKNSSSCSSGTGNHITWADGDCSAADLAKPKATWPGFGGNQGDAVKRSIYCAKGDCGSSRDVICRVFWHEKNLPPAVKQSKNCTGSASGESTR